ncbi:hypothetical protein BAUCODRAFT_412501 [Baudoinia panamericana UAMH 10762]|uniref:Urease accessory protein UreD n=1 Tax=Baudoinia panamericana (strain UAMH 10762) TaxID=717646 RepID=M2NFQ4_BAUPA|nr:uncharacterized protein BAUCODRAFT_412501 [Baudoinia panamericana UAMH 10762]EMC98084.1 hypothetical protein BAUCODRAFT_412501 [Baudoinia panamericana UAMH 10762]
MSNPFQSDTAKPGHGSIHLALLPPDTPRLRHANYQYPLKLISPAPVWTDSEPRRLIHTVYLLTYGGGLVAGDCVDLNITLEATTRLILLTQGSTKLFKSPSRQVLSRQTMTVHLATSSALCYLPDPVQPFEHSCFEQQQIYNVAVTSHGGQTGNLCVLDWVSNGRPANGENWSLFRYGSRNEVYLVTSEGKRKLLLRDNVMLDDQGINNSVASRMHGLATFGTLILYGPMFQALGNFFVEEFKALPRVGGRKWDSGSESGDEIEQDRLALRQAARQRQETAEGVLWSAASVRGCVVIKFGAPHLEAGKKWLKQMLSDQGTVATTFGERALLCLR